jgi:hypothetical protein
MINEGKERMINAEKIMDGFQFFTKEYYKENFCSKRSSYST